MGFSGKISKNHGVIRCCRDAPAHNGGPNSPVDAKSIFYLFLKQKKKFFGEKCLMPAIEGNTREAIPKIMCSENNAKVGDYFWPWHPETLGVLSLTDFAARIVHPNPRKPSDFANPGLMVS